MRFEWDDTKNAENQRKHGVSFEEASRLFDSDSDPYEFFDGLYEGGEERMIAIGPIATGMMVVVFAELQFAELQDETIRIISARRASQPEIERYRRHMDERQ